MTTTTNEQRESRSDERMTPLVWYVYIIDDGERFYVGQTNDLETRLIEHGANGKSGRLVWFNQASSRDAAKNMERRLQRTLSGDRGAIVRLVEQFDRLMAIMRPQKTLRELREDERQAQLDFRRAFHLVPVAFGARRPACDPNGDLMPAWHERAGLYGIEIYGSSSPADLVKMADDRQSLADSGLAHLWKDRMPCPACVGISRERMLAAD